jgi:hypothetical protein
MVAWECQVRWGPPDLQVQKETRAQLGLRGPPGQRGHRVPALAGSTGSRNSPNRVRLRFLQESRISWSSYGVPVAAVEEAYSAEKDAPPKSSAVAITSRYQARRAMVAEVAATRVQLSQSLPERATR